MIKHIVMFKLNQTYQGDERHSIATHLKTLLESLPEKIPDIKLLEVGLDVSHSTRSADMVLVTVFNDSAALDRYQHHPDHQDVVTIIRQHVSESWVVDYDC